MAKYIIKRLVAGVLSPSILITIISFPMHAIPGGPFSPSERRNVPEKILEQISERYGLNDPFPVQYARYLGNLLHGDMGISLRKQDTTVNELIVSGLPVSAKVGVSGTAAAPVAGIPLGIVVAVKWGKLVDGASMVLATISVSVSSFMLCVLMMYIPYEKWKVFPSYDLISWKHYVLPVFCMTFSQMAYITRLMRPSMLETMRQDYIRTERSKGVLEWEAISKYVLKNSILPVVTYVGPLMATLFTGTFIIEKLFSIPGLGRYFISAITDRDYFVTLGLTASLGVMIIGRNLVVDIMYAAIDSRTKIME